MNVKAKISDEEKWEKQNPPELTFFYFEQVKNKILEENWGNVILIFHMLTLLDLNSFCWY